MEMLSDFLILAGQSIVHRKVRSWLTVIGVFIGITAVVALLSIGLGFEKTIDDQIAGVFGSDTFMLSTGGMLAGGPRNTGAAEQYDVDIDYLLSVEGVKTAAVIRQRTGYVESETETGEGLQGFFPVMGLTTDMLTEFTSFFGEIGIEAGGRFFEEGEIAVSVLGADIAQRFDLSVGDELLIGGSGSQELVVRVVGILETEDDTDDAAASGPAASRRAGIDRETIGVPYEAMDQLWGDGEDVVLTVVKTAEGYDVDEVADRVEGGLMARGSELQALTYTDVADSIGQITSTISAFLAGIAGISLLVGGVGVMNTMYTSVLERTKEIGVMKAVGAKNSHVLSIFLIESGLMGLVGGIVGTVLGLLLNVVATRLISTLAGLDLIIVISPVVIVATLVGSFALGALAGLWPARRASKLRVVEALRYE